MVLFFDEFEIVFALVWVYETECQRKLASSIITRPKNHNIQNKFMESSTSYQKFGVAFGELPDVLYW